MNWLNSGHDIMHTCNYRMCLKIMMGHHVFFWGGTDSIRYWGVNQCPGYSGLNCDIISSWLYIYIPVNAVKYLWYPFKWLVTLVSKSPKMVIPFINHPTYQPLTISGMILQVIHESLGFSGIRISDQVGYIYIYPITSYSMNIPFHNIPSGKLT